MALLKQSTAYTRAFFMVASSGSGAHFTGKASASPSVSLSKAGGTFAAAGGTVTELANGWYKIALTTTDTNTLGDLAYRITGTGADTTDFTDQVVAVNVEDAVRFGLSALPNAAAEAAGGLYTRGTGAGQINQPGNGRIDVNLVRWLDVAPNGLNFGRVSATHGMWTNGIAQSGSNNSITLDAGEESTDDFWNGAIIVHRDQFGSFVNPRKFQARLIIDYNGTTKVATVYPNWATDPISSDYYEIWPFGAANLAQWLGIAPNALISGRVDANAQVVADKTGYSLTATGLDSITASDPGGVASTFPQMLVQLWRRMFKKSTLDSGAGELKTYADNGTTVRTTQTVSDTGGVQTQNAAT